MAKRIKSGFKLHYKKRKYRVIYPHHIWKSTPRKTKKFVIDNVSFLSTAHMPLALNKKQFSYATSAPLFKRHYNRLFVNYLPYIADSDSRSTGEMLKQFRSIRYKFGKGDPVSTEPSGELGNRAVISFTFGKDSLLSYCLANELGMDPALVYMEEPDPENSYENMHKKILIRNFENEFGKKVIKFRNGTGLLRYNSHFNARKTELGWTHQLTEYFVELLPVCYSHHARFVVFGNEQSCNDFYRNNEGYKCFPSYDQTSEWMLNLDRMAKKIDRRLHVMSLVEPLHDIAITRILHNRYKDIAKYQTSCFADKKKGKDNRWCHFCSKCGRIYVLFKANNINPQSVGFKKNLFDKQFMNYYTIFNGASKTRSSLPYDSSGLGRDEQILAFYLAYKNGAKGYLINKFRQNHLAEAKEREDELHKKFFAIKKPVTMPREIEREVLKIYREELGN